MDSFNKKFYNKSDIQKSLKIFKWQYRKKVLGLEELK